MAKRKIRKDKNPSTKISSKKSKNISLKKYLPLAFLVAALGFILYANTFKHDWALDDYSVIKENWVTQQGIAGIPTHFSNSYRYGYGAGFGTLYRPLTPAMFALEWQIIKDSPEFMHIVNVLFYALSGFLLFFTLARVFQNYNILLPFAATLIFIAHPLHTESVANIKGRDDIMGFLFFLLAIYWLWSYLKNPDWKWFALSLGSFFLSVLSKESSVTFVAIIPLMVYFFTKTSNEKNLKLSAGYLGVALLFLFIRSRILVGAGVGIEASVLDNVLESTDNFMEQKATAFAILGRYFKLMFVPHPLVSDAGYHQIPITSWANWRALLSFAIHAGLGVIALLQFKKKSILSFAILFYILTFSLTSNIFINIGTSYAERLLYVPVLGFAIAMAYGLLKLFKLDLKRDSDFNLGAFFQKNNIAIILLGTVVIGFSLKTVTRNFAWKDSFELYSTDVKISPNCAKLQYHYGLELKKRGETLTGQEQADMMNFAKSTFEKAIEIYPRYHDAYMQLGLWHYQANFKDKAVEYYQKSIEYKPNNPKALSNLGVIYFEKGSAANNNPALGNSFMQQAQQSYELAIKYDPKFVDALRNLGAIHAIRKEFPQAIQYFERGLKYATTTEQKETLTTYLSSARAGK